MAKREQLCWSCLKCYGDCSWTEMGEKGIRFEPIPGWTARKSKMGYLITACPEYVADETAKSRTQNSTKIGSVKNTPIRAVNKETGEVLRFATVSDAERELGFCPKSVRLCLKGRAKSHRGFWIKEDET